MAARRRKQAYPSLRPHAARILKLAEYPTHVNGAYLDDPQVIPIIPRPGDKPKS